MATEVVNRLRRLTNLNQEEEPVSRRNIEIIRLDLGMTVVIGCKSIAISENDITRVMLDLNRLITFWNDSEVFEELHKKYFPKEFSPKYPEITVDRNKKESIGEEGVTAGIGESKREPGSIVEVKPPRRR